MYKKIDVIYITLIQFGISRNCEILSKKNYSLNSLLNNFWAIAQFSLLMQYLI